MDEITIALLLLVFLLVLLANGIWVAIAMLLVGFVGIEFFTNRPVGTILASTLWGHSNKWSLAALPMFIWMGEILFRSRLSEDLFSGLVPWTRNLPGRLAHVNIFGCAIFAAVSGSSAATCATVGKMSLPVLAERGYDERLSIGTLAGSATLGLLIPPSIILIVYGVAAEVSIGRLFIAGILPGLLLVGLFAGYVMLWSLLNPSRVPPQREAYSWADRIFGLRRLGPIILLIAGIMGSIYLGFASPTDAAALGVLLALLLTWLSGDLTWASFRDGLLSATATSCMIAFILIGAAFLTVAMGYTGIPRQIAEWITAMDLPVWAFLAILTVFFIVLGCFLDGISVVVLTAAVVLPSVEAQGLDLIWFGIFLVIVVEMSQITPPVGFNLFVLQGLTGRNILHIAMCALPFFLLMVLAVVLLVAFPGIATWLPEQMTSR